MSKEIEEKLDKIEQKIDRIEKLVSPKNSSNDNIELWKRLIRQVHAAFLIAAKIHTGEKIAWRDSNK